MLGVSFPYATDVAAIKATATITYGVSASSIVVSVAGWNWTAILGWCRGIVDYHGY